MASKSRIWLAVMQALKERAILPEGRKAGLEEHRRWTPWITLVQISARRGVKAVIEWWGEGFLLKALWKVHMIKCKSNLGKVLLRNSHINFERGKVLFAAGNNDILRSQTVVLFRRLYILYYPTRLFDCAY